MSDLISRQAVIDTLTKTSGIRGDALKALYDLPSVSPQQRTGRWIGAEVLDKIRAEIAVLDDADYDYEGYYKAVTDALQIIDKYKAESEDKE